MKQMKRWCSALLALAMVLTMLPATVLAEDTASDYAVSDVRFYQSGSNLYLRWTEPEKTSEDESLFYAIYFSTDKGATWTYTGSVMGYMSLLSALPAGVYNAVKIVTTSSAVDGEAGVYEASDYMLTITGLTLDPAAVSFDSTGEANRYDIAVSGLTPDTDYKLYVALTEGKFGSSFNGKANAEGSYVHAGVKNSSLDSIVADGYYLVREYSSVSVNDDGKQATINYADRGGWTKCSDTDSGVVLGGGSCGENLVWEVNSEGVLFISGTGAMADYSYTSAPWTGQQLDTKITSVEIGSGVTTVGDYAFYNLYNVERVFLPEGIESIGGHAFEGCQGLLEATLPVSVASIGEGAFQMCTSLETVNIPDGVEVLESRVFQSCAALKSIELPDSVTLLDDAAFRFSGLESVTLSEGLTEINAQVFDGCDGLKEIEIPASVRAIGSEAFANCDNLTAVYFLGNGVGCTGAGNTSATFEDTVTLYCKPTAIGWADSSAYNAATGLWNGYKLELWNPEPSAALPEGYEQLYVWDDYHNVYSAAVSQDIMGQVSGMFCVKDEAGNYVYLDESYAIRSDPLALGVVFWREPGEPYFVWDSLSAFPYMTGWIYAEKGEEKYAIQTSTGAPGVALYSSIPANGKDTSAYIGANGDGDYIVNYTSGEGATVYLCMGLDGFASPGMAFDAGDAHSSNENVTVSRISDNVMEIKLNSGVSGWQETVVSVPFAGQMSRTICFADGTGGDDTSDLPEGCEQLYWSYNGEKFGDVIGQPTGGSCSGMFYIEDAEGDFVALDESYTLFTDRKELGSIRWKTRDGQLQFSWLSTSAIPYSTGWIIAENDATGETYAIWAETYGPDAGLYTAIPEGSWDTEHYVAADSKGVYHVDYTAGEGAVIYLCTGLEGFAFPEWKLGSKNASIDPADSPVALTKINDNVLEIKLAAGVSGIHEIELTACIAEGDSEWDIHRDICFDDGTNGLPEGYKQLYYYNGRGEYETRVDQPTGGSSSGMFYIKDADGNMVALDESYTLSSGSKELGLIRWEEDRDGELTAKWYSVCAVPYSSGWLYAEKDGTGECYAIKAETRGPTVGFYTAVPESGTVTKDYLPQTMDHEIYVDYKSGEGATVYCCVGLEGFAFPEWVMTDSGLTNDNANIIPQWYDETQKIVKLKLKSGVTGVQVAKFVADVDTGDEVVTRYFDVIFDDGTAHKLSAPTDVKWGSFYYDNDEGTQIKEMPGMISFAVIDTEQRQDIRVTVYKDGEECYRAYWPHWAGDRPCYTDADFSLWDLEEYGSGKYYFTVQAVPMSDDKTTVAPSEIVTSEVWEYTAPEKKLSAPGNLRWEDGVGRWNAVSDDAVGGYAFDVYYSATNANATGADELEKIKGLAQYNCMGAMTSFKLEGWMMDGRGEGYYYFTVRTLSGDVTAVRHSDESQLSGAYHYTGEPELPKMPAVSSLWWDTASGCPGWTPPDEETEYNYHVVLYKDGEPCGVEYRFPHEGSDWIIEDFGLWELEKLGSGSYHFTVQILSESEEFADGEIVTSPVWNYTAPEKKLAAPADLRWNDTYASWDRVDDEDLKDYRLYIYYSEVDDPAEKERVAICTATSMHSIYSAIWAFGEYGEGYYYFDMQSVSSDVTKARHSDFSQLSPGYYYNGVIASGTCGEDIVWTLSADGILTVSGEGAIPSSADITDNIDRDSVKKIVLESGVTEIGSFAFSLCNNLTEVIIADTVTTIDNSAVSDCPALREIHIPASVTSLSENAFYNCKSLERIWVDEANTVYSDVDGVLFNKEQTELLRFPYGQAKEEYRIPEGTVSLGTFSFAACTGVKALVFPASLTSELYSDVFERCTSLERFSVSGDNPAYSSKMGVLFNKNETVLWNYPSGRPDKSYEVPEGTVTIWHGAFEWCTNLTRVTIPYGVTWIDSFAFNGCTELTEVIIPYGVTKIGMNAFKYCTALTNVRYGGSEEQWAAIEIKNGNESLTGAAISYLNDTVIGSGQCGEQLTWSMVSDGTLTISGRGNMYDYAWNVDAPWREHAALITSVVIGQGVTYIGDYAFFRCSALKSVEMPDALWGIGMYAFSSCSALTDVTLPAALSELGDSAFFGTAISEIVIPDGVTKIGYSVFENCNALASVTLSSGLTIIDQNAFAWTALTELTIPAAVTEIGTSAFVGCESLSEICFLGNAPAVAAADAENPSFDAAVILRYLADTTGWTDSDAYDAASGTWNGYKVAVWGKRVEIEEEKKPEILQETNIIVSDASAEPGEKQEIIVTGALEEADEDVIVYFAVYDERGRMIGMDSQVVKADAADRRLSGNLTAEGAALLQMFFAELNAKTPSDKSAQIDLK